MKNYAKILCVIFVIAVLSANCCAQVIQNGNSVTISAKNKAFILGAAVSVSITEISDNTIIFLDDKTVEKDGSAEFDSLNFEKYTGLKVFQSIISTYGFEQKDVFVYIKADADGGINQIMADTKKMPVSCMETAIPELYHFFGFDEFLKLVPEGEYSQLAEKIVQKNISTQDEYKKLLTDAIVLITVKNRVGEQIMNNFEGQLAVTSRLTNYTALTSYQKEELFRNIAGGDYNAVDDVIVALNSTITTMLTPPPPPVISGGSIGGSFGGGSSSVTVTTPPKTEEEPIPESNADDEKPAYTDMNSAKWALEAVEQLSSMGVINGYEDNTFRPDNNVTRAEFLKMLIELTGVSEKKEALFNDVKESDWFYSYVVSAYGAGFAQGYNNFFYPNNDITRQDMCVMCMNVLKYYDFQTSEAQLDFSDKEDIADYAASALQTLYDMKIISGMPDGSFKPENTATRAEAANVIYKMWNVLEGM